MSYDPFATLLTSDAQRLLRTDLPTPLYHQLFSLLRDRILSGEAGKGARIPTEFELSAAFKVSRITAKRALDILAEEGLVERKRGKGTHVIHSPQPRPMHSPLTGLLETLEVLAENTQVKLLQFQRSVPSELVRRLFKTAADQPLTYAVRLRLRNKVPFGYYSSWTHSDHALLTEKALASTSRLKLFRDIGIEVRHVEQTLSAVNADAVSAMHLGVEPGTALLALERRSCDHEGNLVDLLSVLYRPDQFSYRMQLDMDTDGLPPA